MNIIYEGTDITADIGVKKADIYDHYGGKADCVDLLCEDTKDLWSQWKPKIGEKIILKESGFTSGGMNVDDWHESNGIFRIRGISTPLDAKTINTKPWENIRLLNIASDISSKQGLKLETYNVQNWLYDRIDQVEQTDLEFLNQRCILEGYVLKITDSKLVVYNEKTQEQTSPVATIYPEDLIRKFDFKSMADGLYSSCAISYIGDTGLIKYEFKPSNAPKGPVLKKNIRVSSQGEAERFSKGLLRYANKYEVSGSGKIKLNPDIAAGNMVEIKNIGLADGKYFVERVIHKLASDISFLTLRKPLEGY